uniref:Uncharacterized protein n=1 Tax=Globodera rostochiensis TaxID=31243 RepID=A0A914I6R8_GLORO
MKGKSTLAQPWRGEKNLTSITSGYRRWLGHLRAFSLAFRSNERLGLSVSLRIFSVCTIDDPQQAGNSSARNWPSAAGLKDFIYLFSSKCQHQRPIIVHTPRSNCLSILHSPAFIHRPY